MSNYYFLMENPEEWVALYLREWKVNSLVAELSPIDMLDYIRINNIPDPENMTKFDFITSKNEEVKRFAMNFFSFYSWEPIIIEYILQYLKTIESKEERNKTAYELESILLCSEKTSMFRLVKNMDWELVSFDISDLPF